jgi:hypothetical protein
LCASVFADIFDTDIHNIKPISINSVEGTEIRLKRTNGDEIDISSHFSRVDGMPVDCFEVWIARYGKFRKFDTNSVVLFRPPGVDIVPQRLTWYPPTKVKKSESISITLLPDDFYTIAFSGGGAFCNIGNYVIFLDYKDLGSWRSLWRKSGLKR